MTLFEKIEETLVPLALKLIVVFLGMYFSFFMSFNLCIYLVVSTRLFVSVFS